MAVSSSERCTEIVRTYQGLATFESRCGNRAKRDGLCGTHLRSRGLAKVEKQVRLPLGDPEVEVRRTTKVALEWPEGQGPVFPRSNYDAKSVSWLRLSVEVEGEITEDTRLDGMGAFTKDNGEPGKSRTTMSDRKISDLPDAVLADVLALFQTAASS